MHLYFHTSLKETILFDFWIVKDVLTLTLSLIAIFLLSFAYEGLKFYREYVYLKTLKTLLVTIEDPKAYWKRKNNKNTIWPTFFKTGISMKPKYQASEEFVPIILAQTTCTCAPSGPCKTPKNQRKLEPSAPPTPNLSIRTMITNPSTLHNTYEVKMFSWAHTFQVLLHVTQIFVALILMLIFMSCNVWLCSAVILGAGTGFFFFGWKKLMMVDISEHCT